MNIIKKIILLNKISKAYKKAQKLAKDNSELGIDFAKAVTNLKADLETLAGLLPSFRSLINDIKALINE